MEHPHEPLDTILAWQNWAKNNRVVAQMDEPLVTKDSRENLHDTSKATDKLPGWRDFYKELADDFKSPLVDKALEKKATQYFADTIAEFLPELGGQKLYDCFLNAAKQNFEHVQKEYDNGKDLIDCFKGKKK